MSLLEKQLKDKKISSPKPVWVSEGNATGKIYDHLLKIQEEKILAIKGLSVSQLKTKKNFQISAGEVSRASSIAKTTLIVTSSYSKAFKEHLANINKELLQLRDARVNGYEANQQSVKQRKKNVIVEENQSIKKAYEALQKENAAEQVRLILSNLSLPVKNKLGIK